MLQGCHHAEKMRTTKRSRSSRVTDTLLREALIDTVKGGERAIGEINLTGGIAPDENKMVKIFLMVSGVSAGCECTIGRCGRFRQTLAVESAVRYHSLHWQSRPEAGKRHGVSAGPLEVIGLAKDFESSLISSKKALAENKSGRCRRINAQMPRAA